MSKHAWWVRLSACIHLHIGWPPIPFIVSLSPSALKAPATSSCRRVQGGWILLQHPSLQAPRSYTLFYVQSGDVKSQTSTRQAPETLVWVTQSCSSSGPGVWGGGGHTHLLCSCSSHAPFVSKTHLGEGRVGKRASSSPNRANSLLSNLSARQARMVVTVPGPGSCRSEASCLMVANTNCSVGAREAKAGGNNTNRTTNQYTHTAHAKWSRANSWAVKFVH